MALKILSVVGARPNFIKVAAICEAIKEHNERLGGPSISHVLVHTGQHYDVNMSDSFFKDLDLPTPDLFLGIGSGSHSVQTAKVMERFESVLITERPDVVIVVGDVNSTVACALVTKKTLCSANGEVNSYIPWLAHVEAGLRSFDRTMPEEINRLVTDAVSDVLFTTEMSANENLRREGIPANRIYFVGNVMIDTLLRYRAKSQQSTILEKLKLIEGDRVKSYVILTLHRPGNVDNRDKLRTMLETILEAARDIPIIFPAHPRTLKQIQDADLSDYFVDNVSEENECRSSQVRIRLVPPLGYLDFLQLTACATAVLTDSGGVQEETAILGVPCITLRENTERPITLTHGTNVLAGSNPGRIRAEFERALRRARQAPVIPYLWDGRAAERIIQILCQLQVRVSPPVTRYESGAGRRGSPSYV